MAHRLLFLEPKRAIFMILSSDELEILEYLKSWDGKYVAMIEICRCAGGRKKFKETPNWAKPLMSRLVESKLAIVNERGHYLYVGEVKPVKAGPGHPAIPSVQPGKTASIVGDDYFPAANESIEAESARWVSPQIAAILKNSGKKFGGHRQS